MFYTARMLSSAAVVLLALAAPMAARPLGAAPSPAQPATPQTRASDEAEYKACLELAQKKPDSAVERAKAWWDSGGNFGPRHCLAVALVHQESYLQAARLLEDLANDAQQEIAALKADLFDQAGQAYYLAGMNAEAVGAYDRAIAIRPRDADFRIDRAVARDELGQHFEAIDDLNLAIEIAPDRAEAWLYRANAYRHVNSLDLALDDANRAVALSRSPEALLERATIKALRKDQAGARADLQAVVKLAPDSEQGKEAAKRLKNQPPPQKPPPKKK